MTQKTGLQILKEMADETTEKLGSGIFETGHIYRGNYGMSLSYRMHCQDIVFCQKTPGQLEGTTELPPLWQGGDKRLARWEYDNGKLLEGKIWEDFRIHYLPSFSLPDFDKFSERWPEFLESYDSKIDSSNSLLLTTSGYEDRGHYMEGEYEQGIYIVDKKNFRDVMEQGDKDFSIELKPECKYWIYTPTFNIVFPYSKGWFSGTGFPTLDSAYKSKYEEANGLSINEMKRIGKQNLVLSEVLEEKEQNIKAFYGHLKQIPTRKEKERLAGFCIEMEEK